MRQQDVVVNDQNISVPINTDDDDVYELDGSIVRQRLQRVKVTISIWVTTAELTICCTKITTLQKSLFAINAPVSVVENDEIAVTLTATSTSNTQQTIMVDLQVANVTGSIPKLYQFL